MSEPERTVVITGAASGIGRATAERLERAGSRVIALDMEELAPVGLIVGYRCDVRDDSSVVAAAASVRQRFGPVHGLVNCAGIGAQGTVEHATDDEWFRVLDVNVVGTARVSRAFLPMMRLAPGGSIVNIASIAATAGLPARAVYSASKGAILALTRAMAADCIDDGIRVNAVSPGTVDTPWVKRLLDSAADPEAERRALEARQPTGRLVTAEQVASAIEYLLSSDADSITGTAIEVDGGMAGLRLRQARV
jgi:2-keto-3-deoxy-L-fuconate dehydrogenase